MRYKKKSETFRMGEVSPSATIRRFAPHFRLPPLLRGYRPLKSPNVFSASFRRKLDKQDAKRIATNAPMISKIASQFFCFIPPQHARIFFTSKKYYFTFSSNLVIIFIKVYNTL